MITDTLNAPRRIAITLDDGPNEPYTSKLLTSLACADVKVTLFQVGRCIQRYPEITQRAFAEGHVIGNHSFTHQFHKYLLSPRMIREIDANQQLIYSLIGRTPLLLRAPWFMHTPGIRSTAAKRSLNFVTGTFPHPIEVLQPNVASIAGHALKHARDGSILIFHDGYRWRQGFRGNTIEAINVVVAELKRQGYTFVTANELLNVPAYLEPLGTSAIP